MTRLVNFPTQYRRRTPARFTQDSTLRRAESLLTTLGDHSQFVEIVLGDMTEEYTQRAERSGVRAARWWYVAETMRTAPHVLAHTARHGSSDVRRLLAGIAVAMLLVPCLVVALLALRDGPPDRLMLAGGSDDGLVVHNTRPVQLPIRVLDESGTILSGDSVQFAWASGAPIPVSSSGVVTCTERGDAVVHASLVVASQPGTAPVASAVRASFTVRCRPVTSVKLTDWHDFVIGEPARALPVALAGLDSQPETLRAATIRVGDSTVATLDGLQIRPVAPGMTHVVLYVGDVWWPSVIRVFAPVPSFEGLTTEQRYVAAPYRLMPGDTIRWPLPKGRFALVFMRNPWVRAVAARDTDDVGPVVEIVGPASCAKEYAPREHNLGCWATDSTATIIVTPIPVPTARACQYARSVE